MNRVNHHQVKGLLRLTLCGVLLAATSSLAQYRPPPATEAERLSRQAETFRLEGNKALLENNKSRAAERLKKAVDLYAEALKHDPHHVGAAEGFGECASTLGQNDKVIELLQPVMAANPGAMNVAYHLGVALIKTRRIEEAVPYLEKVSPSDAPEHLIVHFYLGRYYLAAGRPDASVAALEKYLHLRPARLAQSDHEIHALLGHAHLIGERPTQARTAFDNAQRGRPETVPLQMGIAATWEMEGDPRKAVQVLDGLAVRFPSAPEPRERLGWLKLAAGELNRAQDLAAQALALRVTPSSHHLAGEVYLARKNFKAAEPHLRKALELAPDLQPARFGLARAIQQQGRHPEAISLLEQAAQGGLDTLELWAHLGSTYRRAGRYQEAIQAHRKVVARQPEAALGHVLLGADYFATGEWDQAIESYGLAVKKDPAHAGARRWLALSLAHRARALARQEQVDDAARTLRRAWDLERTAPMARSLAAVLLSQKEYAEAAEVLARGVELPGAGWREHLLRGYAQLGTGQAPAALESFETAARLTQDPAALGDIYAGWALTKLELGEFDTALSKLLEPGQMGRAAQVTENNLPLALVRRTLDKMRTGDVEGAARDLDSLEKIKAVKDPEVLKLSQFARGLLAVEQGRVGPARAHFQRALAGKSKWTYRTSGDLAEAYLEYRRGNIPASRKKLAQLRRLADPAQVEFLVQLQRAQDRREGELAYQKSNLRLADKALRAALQDDPLNAWVINNLGAVQYRSGKYDDATLAWEKVAPAVPAAHLNLGIDAQLRKKDIEGAVRHYSHYIAARGTRTAQVREWKDRLVSIYGVAEPRLPDPPADSAAAAAADDAPSTTAVETP